MNNLETNPPANEGTQPEALKWWLQLITWLCRIAFGCTFIYSGFVKAVDPWGTFYKFTEYTEALGITSVPNLILAGVFGLCAIEFLIGIFILTGCYRKSAPVLGCAFMAVMLPLTLWIAIKDPVADCGCFGEALIISNWATFWKNVVLTAMIIWLLKFDRKSYALITPALQWLGVTASLIFIGIIMSIGYFKQPLIDYRNYPVGEPIALDEEDSGEQFVFVYKKNGESKEFGEDDELPSEEDGWEFVERKEIKPAKTDSPYREKTFRIWDITGNDDMTMDVLEQNDKILMLLSPDLASVSPAKTWKINSLYDKAADKGIEMIAVVAADTEMISTWEDLSMPQYTIYTAEDTSIKEVARGNPAVVYIENGIVKWKSTLSSINVDSLTDSGAWKRLQTESEESGETVRSLTYIFICVLGVLIALSFMPRLRNAFSPRRLISRFTRGDKARPEE